MDKREIRKMMLERRLLTFATESDRIEGIIDEDESLDHANRLSTLLDVPEMTVGDLVQFNVRYQLRSVHGMNVIVGNHIPPRGGPEVVKDLIEVCEAANAMVHPYTVHQRFETLHPFVDGNGRTGRALWLWQMFNQHSYEAELVFLHKWYYQSLDDHR